MSSKEGLKKIRYELCMSQHEFARLLGIDYSSLSLYELGKRQPGFARTREIIKKLKENGINIEPKDLRDDF